MTGEQEPAEAPLKARPHTNQVSRLGSTFDHLRILSSLQESMRAHKQVHIHIIYVYRKSERERAHRYGSRHVRKHRSQRETPEHSLPARLLTFSQPF